MLCTPMPKTTRRYVVSPLDDIEAMFATALRMSEHKLSRGKRPLKPVFKDAAQKDAFHKMALAEFERARKGKKTDRLQALSYLESRSRQDSSKTRTDFRGIESPRVYVAGHGQAGKLNFMGLEHGGETRSTEQTAAILHAMGLPSDAELRLPVCYSGAGAIYDGTPSEWLDNLGKGTLGGVLKSEKSLAADLHRHLKTSYEFKGTTAGYFGQVFLVPVDSGDGKHFFAVPPRRKNTGTKTIRLRDARVLFV